MPGLASQWAGHGGLGILARRAGFRSQVVRSIVSMQHFPETVFDNAAALVLSLRLNSDHKCKPAMILRLFMLCAGAGS